MLLLYWFLADRNLHMRRDAGPTNCTSNDAHTSVFLYFQYSTRKIHLRHFLNFRVGHFARHFFLSVLLWKKFNSHSFVVTFHLSFIRFTTCFILSSRVRLLNSHERQHATCSLFERWIPVGSSERAVCGFRLSVSLNQSKLMWLFFKRLSKE